MTEYASVLSAVAVVTFLVYQSLRNQIGALLVKFANAAFNSYADS